ncbi:MAG TPA: hypothetical protein VMZ52_07545 [Bryobacteraceae bacterium]|nr:hypothetical protein [Bryobacteraceae bacterium]
MNIHRLGVFCPVAIVGLTFIAGTCFGTTVTFVDRATWLGASTSVTTIDFSGPAAGTAVDYSTSSGLTVSGVQFLGIFSATGYSLSNVFANASQPWYDWGSGAILRGDDYSATYTRSIRAYLPSGGATSLGVDLMTGNTNGGTYTVRVNGTTDYLVPTFARPTRAFFGISSDTPITRIDFINPVNTYSVIDNFSFGSAAAPAAAETPEVATMLLCATGLLLISRKWKRRLKGLQTEALA